MASHNDLGAAGEKLAVAWLQERGYTVLHCNWRHSYYEIDIIAMHGNILHFIEVKTRSGTRLGNPEDSVGKKKMKQLKRAADEFLFLYRGYRWIQFDIIAITVTRNAEPAIFLLADVV